MNRQPGEGAQATGTPHTAPKQTIFQKGAIKTLETLPAGVSQEDLSRNDRRREKPSPGPNPGRGHDSSGDLQGTLWSWFSTGSTVVSQTPNSETAPEQRVMDAAPSDHAPLLNPPALALANPSNLCYLNSLTQALMWIYTARSSARHATFGDIHPLLRSLLNPTGTVQLHRRKAWLTLLQGWQHLHQQHDVAELLTYIAARASIPGLQGYWEARLNDGPHIRTHQQVGSIPLLMLPCEQDKALQQLVEDWAFEQDTRHISGLIAPPDVLSIQLMRFRVSRGGEIQKLEHYTALPARLQVPQFVDGLDTQPVAYALQSVVYHIGDTPHSGHYKTMGVAAPLGEPTCEYTDGLQKALQRAAEHPALFVQNDESSAVRAKPSDISEVMRTWYLAFFIRPQ